jgi:hypothetical protein
VTVEAGFDPSTSTKTARTRIADVVVGDLDDAIKGTGYQESEGRIVLVTDCQVHVFEGELARPGALLASFPVGPGVLQRDENTVVLPDRSSISFRAVSNVQRVVDAAGGAS